MPTVLRKDSFRVVIYFDDHLPSHVHVISADSEVKINLGSGTEQREIIEYRGKRSIAIKALELIALHQSELLEAWRSIHGEVFMENLELSEAALQSQLDRAKERAALADAIEPRATSAQYDRASGQIVIQLKDGATFMFPHELAQGLAGASPEELAAVEVTPSGIGLHWETLDVDLTVPSLLQGIYGTQAWMNQLRQGRRVA